MLLPPVESSAMTRRSLSLAAGGFLSWTLVLSGCSQPGASSASAAGSSATQAPAGGQSPALDTTGASKLFADFRSQCVGKQPRSRQCEMLRSLVVAETAVALRMAERAKDKRAVEHALLALELPDEPELIIAGCRILKQFPDTPGILDKVLPQLANRSTGVQRTVATLLEGFPDPSVSDIGRAWLGNHSGRQTTTIYDEYPGFPSHYAGMGFPKYPGAEWFSPGDSDRSIGWSSKDDATAVTKWFSQALKADALDAGQISSLWVDELTKPADASLAARLQPLIERVGRGDQAAAAELEKLQAEMQKADERQRELADKGLANLQPPASAQADARWVVAKKKDGRVSMMVLVYPVPGIQRTVIRLAWHLADYPTAW